MWMLILGIVALLFGYTTVGWILIGIYAIAVIVALILD